ncbi:MAG: hypothetical protein DRP74_00450 [Candidatus Omnitrophota bacterium]|nr:MAG: hypothetical protein DRP74_00450 [Candidatus Omnitrophota bacterium]
MQYSLKELEKIERRLIDKHFPQLEFVPIVLNGRLKSYNGRAFLWDNKKIELSRDYVNKASRSEIRNTILHELIHFAVEKIPQHAQCRIHHCKHFREIAKRVGLKDNRYISRERWYYFCPYCFEKGRIFYYIAHTRKRRNLFCDICEKYYCVRGTRKRKPKVVITFDNKVIRKK